MKNHFSLILIVNTPVEVDHISFKMTCKCFVSRLNVAFLIYQFLILINIHILDYPDPRLSGPFCQLPMSLDNQGSSV